MSDSFNLGFLRYLSGSSNLLFLSICDCWHSNDLSFDIKCVFIGTKHNTCPRGDVDLQLVCSASTLLLGRLEPYAMSPVDPFVTAESFLVRFEKDEMIGLPFGSNVITLERLALVEIENKHKLSLFVYDHFVRFTCLSDELVLGYHRLELDFCCVHAFIKLTELSKSKIFVVHEVPLPTAVIITITIAFSWEINPLGMPKLISHEIEVSFTSQTL